MSIKSSLKCPLTVGAKTFEKTMGFVPVNNAAHNPSVFTLLRWDTTTTTTNWKSPWNLQWVCWIYPRSQTGAFLYQQTNMQFNFEETELLAHQCYSSWFSTWSGTPAPCAGRLSTHSATSRELREAGCSRDNEVVQWKNRNRQRCSVRPDVWCKCSLQLFEQRSL